MKKIILSAIALIALSTVTLAQEKTRFGIKAGVNMSNYGKDASGTTSRTSFHFGGVAEFKLEENFSIQPELIYSMLGAKAKTNESGVSIDITDKLDYIILPVMAKYYITNGFTVEAGPQFGFLVSAKGKNEGGGEEAEGDIKENFETFDLGLNGGLGYQLPIGIFFQARYTLGVSNILADPAGMLNDVVVTNNNFQISAGYKF